MNNFYKSTHIFIFIFLTINAFSQTKNNAEGSFHYPLKIPARLSGNFGELRTGHLHAGIDFKTQGVTGHKLFAVADGYVSRIKISSGGYGKALYIHHPSLGLTSVYAHLESFNETIDKYVRKEQYNAKSFEIQLFPGKGEFSIKKGELIGFSGNSGSSEGPHLHFELRTLSNQHPINPLKYNFNVTDNIPPKIFQAVLYPMGKNSRINGSNKKLIINTVQLRQGKYTIRSDEPLKLQGKIGFGVKTYDFLNGSRNWCGVYEIKLQIDSTPVYKHKIDEFAFQNTRYINSLIDYEEKIKNKANIQKLFLSPHNGLNIYEYVKDRGLYSFTNNGMHEVQYQIKDVHGNTSHLTFQVQGTKDNSLTDSAYPQQTYTKVFPYNIENKYYEEEIKLDFPKKAFYDTVYFNYSMIETKNPSFFSNIHQVHEKYTPVHKYFSLALKMKKINQTIKDKLFIARIEEKEDYAYEGGEVINGFISTRVREFGEYVVMADTASPVIEAVTDLKSVSKNSKIRLRIKDDLSGIDTYNGFIDGEWVLFEYDAKNDLLFHDLKNSPVQHPGTHELELYVGDKRNNIATYYTEFNIH